MFFVKVVQLKTPKSSSKKFISVQICGYNSNRGTLCRITCNAFIHTDCERDPTNVFICEPRVWIGAIVVFASAVLS